MFDCRGHGLSDGSGRYSVSVSGTSRRRSRSRVLKRNRNIKRVIVFGCSQGAASSIQAAAEDKEDIDGVIAEASILSPRDIINVAPTSPSDLGPASLR